MKRTTVFWLVPEAAAADELRKIISALAKKYNGPVFEPHLTLGFADPEILPAGLPSQIALQAEGIFFTDEFTKNLFVRLRDSFELSALRDSLGISRSAAYDPHLSLFYGHLPRAIQLRLATSLAQSFSLVKFDSVQVISCPNPTRTKDDVASWKMLSQIGLTSR